MQDAVTDHELLDVIHGTPWIADLLTLFDFDVARAADGPIEPVTLPSGKPLATIAGVNQSGRMREEADLSVVRVAVELSSTTGRAAGRCRIGKRLAATDARMPATPGRERPARRATAPRRHEARC